MNEREKIALELLDEIFSQAIPNLHILQPVPETKTITRVIID